MTAKEGEYNGHPTIELTTDGSGYPVRLSFGLAKARLILEHIEDIEKFVEKSNSGPSS